MLALGLALAAAPTGAWAQDHEGTPPVSASLIAPALRVGDCARSQLFYEQALDATVLMSRDLARVHETMLALSSDPAQPAIMLLCPRQANVAPRAHGSSRLIIRVSSMDGLLARLDAAGIAHGTPSRPAAGIQVLNLADPDGHEIELVQSPQPARKEL